MRVRVEGEGEGERKSESESPNMSKTQAVGTDRPKLLRRMSSSEWGSRCGSGRSTKKAVAA